MNRFWVKWKEKAGLLFTLLLLYLVFHPAAAQSVGGNQVWLPVVLTRASVNPVHQGIATYYYASGDGSCMFGPSPTDLMVTALNAEEYQTAAWCGAYVRASGPKGTITVRIVDLCPECKAGHLDLSEQAFAKIADPVQGRVSITWQVISPALSGTIAYHFKDGSSQWWTAVQVRNHRNPVVKLEFLRSGQWVNVPRTSYNYFVWQAGMGPGPYSFRVTDLYGNVLTDQNISLVVDGTVKGAKQFPAAP